MLAESHFIVDLTIVVAGGLAGALLARVLRLPPLVGYLLVGVALGPSGFAIERDFEIVGVLAELGVTLLLFTIGVELSLRWIWRMKPAALVTAPAQIILTAGLGYVVGRAVGWPTPSAVVLGFALALSSTMVVVKLLASRGELHTRQGQVMVAVLLVQDLAAVVMVAALPALSGQAAGGATELLTMAGKGIAFIVWVLVLARWIVPLVMRIAAREYAREVFVIVAAGLCLGGAATGYLLGFSVALGAFAAGLVISESEYSHQFLADVTPLRDLFAMIFFVSLGLLWDVRAVLAQPYLALWLLLAVVVGKPLLVAAAAWAGGYRARSTIGAGLGLAQIGEFSFLVVTIAWRQDLLTEQAHSLIIAVAGVSLLTTPALMRLSDVMCARIGARRYASEALAREERAAAEAMEAQLGGHVLICGYGRVGRVIGETLLEQGRSIVVVDYDQHVALELRSRDVRVVYGDASSPVILRAAGADRAGAGVVALPDSQSTRAAVRELRAIDPDLPIIARVHLSEEVEATYAEGATEVVYAEFEAGLEMIRHALVTLGHDLGQAQALADGVRRGRYRTLARGEDDEGAL